LIKIELASTEEKILVLRNKQKLKELGGKYHYTYLRSSFTHQELVQQRNMQILIEAMPNCGLQLRNGKLLPLQQKTRTNYIHTQEPGTAPRPYTMNHY
jgi:hypothetical protein